MPIRIRTYHELDETASDLGEQVAAQEARVAERLAPVGAVFAVASGKGGVGKSLVASLLASAWAAAGRRVGLLDADLNGPSAARLLGVGTEARLRETERGIEPARAPGGALVMSMALLLERDRGLAWREPESASFVWRGTQERGALREFLSDVAWGELDALLVDLPPGTQRLAELHELVPGLSGTLAVTLPSAASRDAVARALDLARARGVRLLGVVENMAGYGCGSCGSVGSLFPGTAADDLAEAFGIPVSARIPFDPALAAAADGGRLGAWLEAGSPAAREVRALADRLEAALGAAREAGA